MSLELSCLPGKSHLWKVENLWETNQELARELNGEERVESLVIRLGKSEHYEIPELLVLSIDIYALIQKVDNHSISYIAFIQI